MLQEIFEKVKECAIYIEGVIGESEGEYFDSQNKTGDMQLKADVKADLIIEKEFSKVSSIKAMCSEEKEECVYVNPNGKYHLAYDPLDGSSLVEVNLSVGTIYGIYEGEFDGKNLVAAAYVSYGPGIELVWADSEGVKLYTYQFGAFEYKKDIKMGQKGMINAPGGTQQCWYPHHKKLIDDLFSEGYRLRYSGGMVPDIHQMMIKGGGLFSYPGATDKPEGKLRLTFEVLPFSYIVEKAGGYAVDGKKRLLEIKPEHYHSTSPAFFGSKYEIDRVLEYYKDA
jgi:fructose-1,6-bisphosphatase I